MPDYDQLAYNLRKALGVWLLPFTAENIGTWTPVFTGTTTVGSYTYTAQVGHYTRLGNLCFIEATIGISAITVAPTGNVAISGLPFNAANVTSLFASIHFGSISNFKYAAGAIDLTAYINPNTAFIALRESFGNAGAVDSPCANFTNANCQLIFSGHYEI